MTVIVDEHEYMRKKLNMEEYTPKIFKRISVATTGMIPRKYQIRAFWPVIKSILNEEGQTFFIEAPRQCGKSQGIAEVVSQVSTIIPTFFPDKYPHLAEGFHCGVYAPKKPKADLLASKIKDRVNSFMYTEIMGIHSQVSNGNTFKLSNGSEMLTSTASPNATCLEGPTLHACIIEEAQGVKDFQILKSIRPQLAATNGTMVYVYTASDDPKEHGLVYRACMKEQERIKRGLPPDPRFRLIDLKDVFKTPGTQKYRKYVKAEIRRLGINHPTIQSQYFRKWDTETGLEYLTLEILDRCRKGKWQDSELEHDCIVSLDVARVNDSTVLTIMRIDDRHILAWYEWIGDNYAVQSKEIKKILRRYKVVSGKAEVTGGYGQGLLDFLVTQQQEGDVVYEAIDYIDGLNTSEGMRTQSFIDMKEAVRHKFFTYPEDVREERVKFELQMCSLIKKKKGNAIRIDHPSTVDGRSDYPDGCRLILDDLYDMFSEEEIFEKSREGEVMKIEKRKFSIAPEKRQVSANPKQKFERGAFSVKRKKR